MIRVQLESRLGFRHLLAGGRQDTPHARAHIVLAENEARRRLCQANARAYFLNTVAQNVLDALEESFAFLHRLIALLAIRFGLQVSQLQIAARRILEALVLELIELAHHPLIDSFG